MMQKFLFKFSISISISIHVVDCLSNGLRFKPLRNFIGFLVLLNLYIFYSIYLSRICSTYRDILPFLKASISLIACDRGPPSIFNIKTSLYLCTQKFKKCLKEIQD